MNEEWRPVSGYEDRYQVSNLGKVKSIQTKEERPIPVIRNVCVELKKDGIRKYPKVSTLLGQNFTTTDLLPTTDLMWKDLKGYEGLYRINNKGTIFTTPSTKETILSPAVDPGGYFYVCLFDGTKVKNKQRGKHYKVHRLVAQAFLEPPPEALVQESSRYQKHLKGKVYVNHIDGDKQHNHITNLEWASSKQNNDHALQTGLKAVHGEFNGHSKLTEENVLEMRQLYKTGKYTQKQLAEKYGVSRSLISQAINKVTWSHI